MRPDAERLIDIQEAIEHIERHAVKGRDVFERDELIQTWMVHHLQIIGEACAGLSDETKQRYDDVSWKDIVGMRNVLVHGYFDIDLDLVWSTVERDVPVLKRTITRILEKEEAEAGPNEGTTDRS